MNLNGIISNHLARGKRGALATIVEKAGSAPRGRGASMFVTAEGKSFGTIGGGSVEAEACLEAIKVIETGHHRMLHIGMNGKNVSGADMICGGNISIFLEPIQEKYKEVYDAAGNAMKRGAKGFVVTRYSSSGLLKSFIPLTGPAVGDALDEKTKTQILSNGERLIVSEGLIVTPIITRFCLYIFGAGHVSQHISRIANMVSFDVTVIDDRDDYSNAVRFPDAKKTIVKDFCSVFDCLPFSGSEYVVIVTRGHEYDAYVLEEVLNKPVCYVGMIGSRRKTDMIFDRLKAKGVDETIISQVFAPVGLDIGAETPEEIAVSIVAELIQTRNQQNREQNLSMRQTTKTNNEAQRHHSSDHHKVLFG